MPSPATEVEVWWLELDDLPWADGLLEACLAPDERARADRFRFERDRRRFVRRRGALRFLLAGRLDVEPVAVALTTGPYGRPELGSAPGRRLRFNQSSSGEVAVFAMTAGHDVGIDVELHRDDLDLVPLATRFFSPREVAELGAEPTDAARTAAFFACWTMKEAFVKARGDGLSLPLDGFDVDFRAGVEPRGAPATSALLATRWDPGEVARWCLRPLPAPPGCSAALAVESGCAETRVVTGSPGG